MTAASCGVPWGLTEHAEKLDIAGLGWSMPMRHLVIRKVAHKAPDTVTRLSSRLPAALHRCVLSRQYEFLLGRLAAEAVLRGWLPPELARCGLDSRLPLWPAGFMGSISHSSELVVAVAGPCRESNYSVGTDMEALCAEEHSQAALLSCLAGAERELLAGIPYGYVLGFSAKESLYKCLSPHIDTFLDFTAARVIWVDSAAGELGMQLERDLSGHGIPHSTRFVVRYCIAAGHVWTGTEYRFLAEPPTQAVC